MDNNIEMKVAALNKKSVFHYVTGVVGIGLIVLSFIISIEFLILAALALFMAVVSYKKYRRDTAFFTYILNNYSTDSKKVIERLDGRIDSLGRRVSSNLEKSERSVGSEKRDEYNDAMRFKREQDQYIELKDAIVEKYSMFLD